jgi:hypothetical protein
MDNTVGLMEENMLDNGIKIKCMDVEFINGTMVENTKDNINLIRSMVMVSILGLMEENMMVVGVMDLEMEEVNTF